MSQFIDTANQDLLWNTFQKIPEVVHLSLQKKQSVFRNAISTFYQQINPKVILRGDQLILLNKQVLTHLIEEIRKLQPQQSQHQPPPKQYQYYETTEETTQRIFTEKQKMYEQMTAKPNPPTPSELFREPTSDADGAIQNMDELINQYREQREHEVTSYDPIKKSDLQTMKETIYQLETRVKALENHFTGLDKATP